MRKKRGYTAHQFHYAFGQWREDMRGRAPELALTAVLALLAGVWSGTEGIVEGGVLGGLIGAVVGAIGGPLLFAIALFLLKFFQAPAAIWREQAEEIDALRKELNSSPYIDPSLELLGELSNSTGDRQHYLSAHLLCRESAKSAVLEIKCSAPMLHVSVSLHLDKARREQASHDPILYDKVVVRFPVELAVGNKIELLIRSIKEIRLVSVRRIDNGKA